MKILVTKQLTDAQLDLATRLGLQVTTASLLRAQPLAAPCGLMQTTYDAWAFTSHAGVNAYLTLRALLPPPPTTIYAVGAETALAVRQLLGITARVPTTASAFALASLLIEDGQQHIWHLCGKDRRPELRQGFAGEGRSLTEIIVYQTVEEKIELALTGCAASLFFSPRAVNLFQAQLPGLPASHLLFAIGTTTAQALRAHYTQPVYTPPTPSVAALLHTVAQHLPAHA